MARAGTNQTSSQNSETRERVNYEVSETHRELIRQPGAIKRLTVAVLVDATLVRLAIGPALLQLAGRWNWWPGDSGVPQTKRGEE